MIDRDARNKLAESIRGLASGLLTNDQFEDSVPNSKDRAINEIYSNGAWSLYSDTHEYKLKGKDKLTKEDKNLVSRWVLFLKGSSEYKWPTITLPERFLCLVTLGLWRRKLRAKWNRIGDIEFWPFLNSGEFEEAKGNGAYLGVSST